MTSKLLSSNPSKVKIPEATDKSLLRCIEDNGIDVGASCRNGFCGGCKITVHDGEFEYTSPPLTILGSKECLPCICVPKGCLYIISK